MGSLNMLKTIGLFIPALISILATILVLFVVNHLLSGRRWSPFAEDRFRRLIVLGLVALLGLVATILALPVSPATRGQLIGFLGLVLTAAIAFSSTTFIGNVMAGFMLRSVGHFRPGDFVSIGEHFGRVSAQGLFTTEVQTQDRDLTTFPNLFLVTNPMTVIRSSGAIVSAKVSLGYDVPHSEVERLLTQAVAKAGLEEPFAQILELGDFSVTYRAAGFLSEVKQILTVRSRLRASMLDALHENGIEIVSPTFMNQRIVPEGRVFIPKKVAASPPAALAPEELAFDKAEQAEVLDKLRLDYEEIGKKIDEQEKLRNEAKTEEERARLESEVAVLKGRQKYIATVLKIKEDDEDKG